jgi:hypothetical protein
LVVVLESLPLASVLLAIRIIRDRYSCVVIVLARQADSAMLDRLNAVKPHAIVPWPVTAGIVDVSIQTALRGVPEHGSASPLGFDEHFRVASARALRTGFSFAVGAVEIAPGGPEVKGLVQRDIAAEAADRLKGALRKTDVVMRRGQRRLVFLAEEIGVKSVDALGNRMAGALAASAAPEKPVIGMALWRSPSDAPDPLLKEADKMLLEARRRGSASWPTAAHLDSVSKDSAGKAGVEGEPSASGGTSAEPVTPLRILQQIVGWLSLAIIVWVLANYTGITTEALAAQFERLMSVMATSR